MRCLLFVCAVLCAFMAVAQDGVHDWQSHAPVHPGIRLARVRVETPRPMDIYCLQIDAREPGLSFHATGRIDGWVENERETRTQTTRDFIRSARDGGMNMVAAINADGWEPFSGSVWKKEYPADVLGFAVSNGELVSPARAYSSLIVLKDGGVSIAHGADSIPLDAIHTAVSGYGLCLKDGVVLDSDAKLHPRTGIGVCAAGRYVYFMVIDGHRHASRGATVSEVGAWLKHFGAYDGLNMDGGGSSTMTVLAPALSARDELGLSCLSCRGLFSAPVLLVNNPVGDGTEWLDTPRIIEKIFYRPAERSTGNNIGVMAPRQVSEADRR